MTRSEISALGGAAVPAEKRSFHTRPELAREAGKKGGAAVPAEVRSFSTNPQLASRAGKIGGRVAQEKRRQKMADVPKEPPQPPQTPKDKPQPGSGSDCK